MARKIEIRGGKPLHGELEISGAKNAAIAIIPAAMLVDGVCRGRGVGQKALELLCDYAAHTLGLRMVYCQIFADNTACRHLFAKMGFSEVATLPAWVVAEGKKHDLVVVQRFF